VLHAVDGTSYRGLQVTDEAQILARIARGETAALRTIYDRHAGKALGVALRIVGGTSEAEEIVQETFVEVWRRAKDFDAGRGGASAWIVSIARSRAIDRVRSRGVADRTVRRMQAADPAEPARTPLEDVEELRRRERIQQALATLPEEQRTVLVQAYFDGLTQREISERTGQPLGTVKTRVRLALEKLADLLGGTP
jgi:RNA polymerase sigma-70 factor (ECF subfamily)